MPPKLKIAGAPVAEMTPNPNVVELLEQTLAEVKKGEIDGVVILVSHPDGATSDRWATGPNFFWARMLGCAAVWANRYIKRFEG